MMNYQVELDATIANCTDKELAEMYNVVNQMSEDNPGEVIDEIESLAYIALAFIAESNLLPKFRSILEKEIIHRWSQENKIK